MAETFEKDLERLEQIVQALESGELALDESLKRFEEGIKLTKRCEKALTEAEKRIEVLTRNDDGGVEAKPFVDGDAAESGAAECEGATASRKSGAGASPARRAEDEGPDDGEASEEEDEDSLLF